MSIDPNKKKKVGVKSVHQTLFFPLFSFRKDIPVRLILPKTYACLKG